MYKILSHHLLVGVRRESVFITVSTNGILVGVRWESVLITVSSNGMLVGVRRESVLVTVTSNTLNNLDHVYVGKIYALQIKRNFFVLFNIF